jgi:uncharacterized protein with PQ loop repeat
MAIIGLERDAAKFVPRPATSDMIAILAPVTIVVGALGALLPCFQISKMIRERNAHGISVPFVVGGFVTAVVWLAYGLALRKAALLVPDVVAVLVGACYLGTVLVLNRRYPNPAVASREADGTEDDTLVIRPGFMPA